ncbi:Zinc finger, SWIM-type, partial [Sesbania bispinosa]
MIPLPATTATLISLFGELAVLDCGKEMVGSNESVTSDTPELEGLGEASVIYLEEDEEIPIEHGDAYFIDEVSGGVFLVDNDWDGEQSGEDEQWDEPCTEIPSFGDRVPKFRIDNEEDIKGMDLKAFSPHEIEMSFALQAGGYQKIGFRKKDLYNQIHHQRREQCSDAMEALKYLEDIGGKDGKMYIEHTIDSEGRLQHLFWSDGKPGFIAELKKCMLGDYDLGEFSQAWDEMVLGQHLDVRDYTQSWLSLCTQVSIFTVCKRGGGGKEWKVTQDAGNNEFKCDCMRMESRGLPCEHLVVILVHLRIDDLPRCFVLKRWSKGAKDGFYDCNKDGGTTWNSSLVFRSDEAMHICRLIIKLNDTTEEHHNLMEKLLQIYAESKARKSCLDGDGSSSSRFVIENLRDPIRVRTKGRGGGKSTTFSLAVRRRKKRSICKVPGHNKLTCPHSQRQAPLHESEDDDIYFPTQDLDTDMIPGHNQHTGPHSQREAPLHESEDDDIYFPTQDLDHDSSKEQLNENEEDNKFYVVVSEEEDSFERALLYTPKQHGPPTSTSSSKASPPKFKHFAKTEYDSYYSSSGENMLSVLASNLRGLTTQ